MAAVLGLGLLAGAAYAGYWYRTESAKLKTQSAKPQLKTEKPTPTPQPTPTPTPVVTDPTASWKTYANTNYGFEIKYPADKEVVIDTTDPYIGICDLSKSMVSIKLYPQGKTRPAFETEFSGDLAVSIDTEPNPDGATPRDWLTQHCQGTWVVINSTWEDVQVAGIEAQKAVGGEVLKTTLVVFNRGGRVYFVYGWPTPPASQTFSLMLSTFKFLD